MKSLYLIKPYLIEKRRLIFLGLVCLVAVDFLQLFIPRIIKWVVDDIAEYRIETVTLLTYA
ncbi:MAG: ABC transporter ATP-binding protein, partial [Deltaproteobacteria bacterium]|nr:ABC transporter ATP-binding protein [Deltaproteobacteria bacterium]